MAKFSKAKVGDRAWDIMRGRGTIVAIKENEDYPIYFKADIDSFCTFDLDGKRCITDKYPTLFWNEFCIPHEEGDEESFNLVEFLRDNLKPKEFERGDKNFYIYYSCNYNEWIMADNNVNEIPSCVYFANYVPRKIQILNENKVTKEQLIIAFKELGWLR